MGAAMSICGHLVDELDLRKCVDISILTHCPPVQH
jgi:hypothetical protein